MVARLRYLAWLESFKSLMFTSVRATPISCYSILGIKEAVPGLRHGLTGPYQEFLRARNSAELRPRRASLSSKYPPRNPVCSGQTSQKTENFLPRMSTNISNIKRHLAGQCHHHSTSFLLHFGRVLGANRVKLLVSQ